MDRRIPLKSKFCRESRCRQLGTSINLCVWTRTGACICVCGSRRPTCVASWLKLLTRLSRRRLWRFVVASGASLCSDSFLFYFLQDAHYSVEIKDLKLQPVRGGIVINGQFSELHRLQKWYFTSPFQINHYRCTRSHVIDGGGRHRSTREGRVVLSRIAPVAGGGQSHDPSEC